MKNSITSPESGRRNGVIGLGLVPGTGSTTVHIKVSHGANQYEVAVPSNSSFGYIKSGVCQSIGLRPEMHKLFFRHEEKQDDEILQKAGVTNNSEVLLVQVTGDVQKGPEVVPETKIISKGDAAVAEVRQEVDKLVQKISALEGMVDCGTKVAEKEIIYVGEMLMRQLLKLDGIEAEGEGKVQRKIEVRRVQDILEKLDALKSRNSNPCPKTEESQQEPPKSNGASTNPITTEWETFDPVNENVKPCFTRPHLVRPHVPYSPHSDEPYNQLLSQNPHFVLNNMAYNNVPPPQPYYVPHPMPYFNNHWEGPYQAPVAAYFNHSEGPYHVPIPDPYYVPPAAPFPVPPSTTTVTQNWQHFG